METKDKDYVIQMVKERNVKFIRLWFTDILGFLKSFAITPGELEGALDEGMCFDGSSI
jgi:glutamine synthetase